MDWLTLGFSLSPLQVYSLELQQKRKKKKTKTDQLNQDELLSAKFSNQGTQSNDS